VETEPRAEPEVRTLLARVRRLARVCEVAAEACRERRVTPLLVDVLDAEGFETAPRPPDPEWWAPPRRDGAPGGA
jgi:hypothetical protein